MWREVWGSAGGGKEKVWDEACRSVGGGKGRCGERYGEVREEMWRELREMWDSVWGECGEMCWGVGDGEKCGGDTREVWESIWDEFGRCGEVCCGVGGGEGRNIGVREKMLGFKER